MAYCPNCPNWTYRDLSTETDKHTGINVEIIYSSEITGMFYRQIKVWWGGKAVHSEAE